VTSKKDSAEKNISKDKMEDEDLKTLH